MLAKEQLSIKEEENLELVATNQKIKDEYHTNVLSLTELEKKFIKCQVSFIRHYYMILL